MGVLGYKQQTITPQYADKKDALPYLLEKCIRYFMAYLFCFKSYLFRLESYYSSLRTLSVS